MMNIRIYQINHERDTNQAMFMNTEYLAHKFDEVKPDSSSYDLVFEGKVDRNTLEGVYQMFNLDHPAGYVGRSLSVSDVVEVVEGAREPPGFYFCDSIGFTKVPFEPNKVQTLADRNTISVVLVEPGKKARAAHIDGTLPGMQGIVGGDIQVVYPFEEEVCIVCNEEGKVTGLPLNRALRDDDGEIYDIVAGTFFICGYGGENLSSLSADQLKRYTEMYECPEKFMKMDGQIHAIRIHDREKGGEQER